MFVNCCQACAVNFGDMCEVVGQQNTETYLVCIFSLFSNFQFRNAVYETKLAVSQFSQGWGFVGPKKPYIRPSQLQCY